MVCYQGDLERLIWVIKKNKDGLLPLTLEQIDNGLQDVIRGGYDAVLLPLHYLWSIDTMDEEKQKSLIDLALRFGYPNTVRALHELGCPISVEQMQQANALRASFDRSNCIPAPPPINSVHFNAHGGENNVVFFQKEYQQLVAYTLHCLKQEPCDFRRLIEDLGHRRRRMACLGRLLGSEFYGVPTNQPMYTYFSPTYELYGTRVHEKYSVLPKTITGMLNGRTLELTQIHDNCWLHPNGKDREEILKHVASLCQRALEDNNPLLTFGSIIWWLSHAPPFLRGTPTLIYALLDAVCLYHQIPLLTKLPDLNCEALLYDNEEEFALYIIDRETL